MKKILLLICGILVFAGSSFAQFDQRPESEPPKAEFRSIWIATVPGATDWPKSADSNKQQTLRNIVKAHADANMNAIVFQVVGRGDAMFQSERLPWNISLAGLGVDPGFDPLQVVIDEAKKYGIEVHAWYNVFNVGNVGSKDAYLATNNPEHVVKAHPEWVNDFGTGIWMNPGIPEARQWAIDNVLEIVENYDIDAVHFDFARYPEAFPGDTQRYQENNNGFVSILDWRRDNVNEFQRGVYAAIQEIKPWVKVGTTPFGHYQRQGYYAEDPCPPEYQVPLAPANFCSWGAALSYSQVFQDSKRWIDEGVNDYLAPQIYWAIGYPGPHFEFLTRDWARLSNESGRHIYVGIGAYKPEFSTDNQQISSKLAVQVDTIRANSHQGHLFFRMDHTLALAPPTFREYRTKIDYVNKAFVPSMDWKDMDVPPAVEITRDMPVASVMDNSVTLTWDAPEFETASDDTKVSYAVYRVAAFTEPDPLAAIQDPANLLALTGETTFTDSPENTEGENYYYFVTPYSRNWVEGMPSNIVEFLTPTSIDDGDQLASQFKLDQNYPNPFNPSTQIRFSLGEATHATLTIYDMMGRQVATLVDQSMSAGSHSVQFNASELSSGLYVYTLRAGSFTQSNKMMLVK